MRDLEFIVWPFKKNKAEQPKHHGEHLKLLGIFNCGPLWGEKIPCEIDSAHVVQLGSFCQTHCTHSHRSPKMTSGTRRLSPSPDRCLEHDQQKAQAWGPKFGFWLCKGLQHSAKHALGVPAFLTLKVAPHAPGPNDTLDKQ